MTKDEVLQFINKKNYDIRTSRNGRWIDQKCTPDVLWSISDFISEYVENKKQDFTVRNIWSSDYAKQMLADAFTKPSTDDKYTANEYDKFFSQPMCLLCYAGIIEDVSQSTVHRYRIIERDVLEYIAANDRNAKFFLAEYIEKVLRDSGIFPVFDNFLLKQDEKSFRELKDTFINFYHNNTNIKGEYEPKRIFTKVINSLANKYQKKGSKKGRMSTNVIESAELMYNRDNFRDVYRDKPKNMSRKEWLEQHPKINIRNGYFEQQMHRAKKVLKQFIETYRSEKSELTQFGSVCHDISKATQVHHIFPRFDFPDIMHYIENLIALTPNQHYLYAHPNNDTNVVDDDAQKNLLIAKTASIKHNLDNESEKIYDFGRFIHVLGVGWDDEAVQNISNNDFTAILQSINAHYP